MRGETIGHERYEFIRLTTIGLGIVTAGLVDAYIFHEIFNPGAASDGLVRLASAAGIVTACGTVAILILALITRSHTPRATSAMSWVEMTITCPACGHAQKIAIGDSDCSRCRLPISVRIGQRPVL